METNPNGTVQTVFLAYARSIYQREQVVPTQNRSLSKLRFLLYYYAFLLSPLFTPLLHASWYTVSGSTEELHPEEKLEMKKKLLTMAALLLVCVLSAGMASAEHGYARVSDIPMAVDFTYSVEFAEDGTPYVQTDYPFEETGAMQMVLIYINHKEGLAYISYDPATKQASFFHVEVGPRSMDTEQKIQKAAQMIRDGKMELWFIDIGTVHGGPDTDWWLAYHVPQKYYWSYEERTFSPSFYDEKNPDGKLSIIYYGLDGVMTRSYIRKISPSPN